MTKLENCTKELSTDEMRNVVGGKTWLRRIWDWLTKHVDPSTSDGTPGCTINF